MNQNKKTFSEEMFFCFCKIYWGYNISAVFFLFLHESTLLKIYWIFIAYCITNDLNFHCILHHQWLEFSLHNASPMTWNFIAYCITNDLNFHCILHHQWLEFSLQNASPKMVNFNDFLNLNKKGCFLNVFLSTLALSILYLWHLCHLKCIKCMNV